MNSLWDKDSPWELKQVLKLSLKYLTQRQKDEIQQMKLCVSTSSANGIWKRDASLLDLRRLSDQVDELWEGRGEPEALNLP